MDIGKMSTPAVNSKETRTDNPMLRELFEKQAQLNKRFGFDAQRQREDFDPKLAGRWVNNFLMAMSNEIEELRNCTYWKHWCKETQENRRFELHDLQNARVEVIDMLFFWISLAQCLGLDADDVIKLYNQKLTVNHERQDKGYSMAEKTEEDNRAIKL